MACNCGHLELAQLLLDKGADLNVPNADGQTPLHMAAYHAKYEVMEWLLGRGADLDAKTNVRPPAAASASASAAAIDAARGSRVPSPRAHP